MMENSAVPLTVNGVHHKLDVDPECPLIFVLRNDLSLKGVRTGCAVGMCGACTVLADGQPIRSCNTPVSSVLGQDITTIEGLEDAGSKHPVQDAFLENQAAQCGYCVNGIMMSTVAAFESGEKSNESSRDTTWLDDHLCRCGTHLRIRRAIDNALDTSKIKGTPDTRAENRIASTESLSTTDSASQRHTELQPKPDRIETWLALREDGLIEVRSGRVEFGQGVREAMARIAASQIGVGTERIVVAVASTGRVPDEGHTSGSQSIEQGGTALARAAVAFRREVLRRSASKLSVDTGHLALDDDRVRTGDERFVLLSDLLNDGPITGVIGSDDEPDWDAPGLREETTRRDLVAKVSGQPAYVHDIALPGMLHGRAVLPPRVDSDLLHLDTAVVADMKGIVKIVVDGRLIIAIAEREETAVRAASRLHQNTRWSEPVDDESSANLFDTMRSSEGSPYVVAQEGQPPDDADLLEATYTRPYQAHGAMSPSCSVAAWDGDALTVYTHSQGIYPLQRSLAAFHNAETGNVVVIHQAGPGCYGYNLADDAAAFASVAARAVPGRPVRFQFSLEDEFSHEPAGPAMLADMAGALDDHGKVVYWRHHTMTDTHSTRPRGNAEDLMPAWLRRDPLHHEWRGPSEGGARNGVPPYTIPAIDIVAKHVPGPLRTGPLRAVGAFLNAFAAESFMDELAEQVGVDPLAFRLAHLDDPRARDVLLAVADAGNYEPHVGPSGRGVGLAVAQYKNSKAYVAEAIEATIDPETAEITVPRVVIACDAGTIIDPDGVVNQLEGGAIQALSRSLHEEVRFTSKGVQSRDWLQYRTLSFSETPSIEVILMPGLGRRPLGVGEATMGPTAAALTNAIDDRLGLRLRDLPLTPERVTERLYTMEDEEAGRVLV